MCWCAALCIACWLACWLAVLHALCNASRHGSMARQSKASCTKQQSCLLPTAASMYRFSRSLARLPGVLYMYNLHMMCEVGSMMHFCVPLAQCPPFVELVYIMAGSLQQPARLCQ